jgi:predicted metal-binding membrane protein
VTYRFRDLFQSSRVLSVSMIVIMTALAWFYLLAMTQDMQGRMDMADMGLGMGLFNTLEAPAPAEPAMSHHHHHQHSMAATEPATESNASTFGMPTLGIHWSASDFSLVFAMWIMMMVAMMLPTAAPMIVTYSDILNQQTDGSRLIPLSAFISGYLITWGGYSLLAVIAQWGMLQSQLISEMMVGTNPFLNGSLLMIAGLYQWSRLKEVCLTHCRTPLQFFLTSWKSGNKGALQMGATHGAYCVGCCWALMILMFFFGLMNLIWIAALSIIMLAEKVLPKGDLFGKGIGVLFFAWGLFMVGTHLYA